MYSMPLLWSMTNVILFSNDSKFQKKILQKNVPFFLIVDTVNITLNLNTHVKSNEFRNILLNKMHFSHIKVMEKVSIQAL